MRLGTQRGSFALSLAIIGSCLAAQANTVSYYIDVFSGALVATTTPIASGPGVPVQIPAGASPVQIAIPQFNSALGTLTQVDFQLNTFSTATASATNSNTASSENYVNLNTSMPITVSQIAAPNVSLSVTNTAGVPGGTVAAASSTTIPLSGTFTAPVCTLVGGIVSGGNCIMTVPTEQDNPGLTAANSASNTVTSGLDVFESLVPVNLLFNALVGNITVAGTETSGNGDLHFSGSGTAGAIFEVTYEYTLVDTPEPTSMLLIGSSFLGLGLILRKKRK